MADTSSGATTAYTVAECLVKLRLSRDTFYRMIPEGKLSARKLGRKTLVLESDLQAFLEGLPKIGA